MSVIEIVRTYQEGFARGLLTTLKLCLIVWLAGLVMGTVLGILGSKFKLLIGLPSKIVSFILSGTPVLVFLFWIHYPLQTMLNLNINPFYTTAMTISIINIFAVTEIVRNGISELPQQYVEAAKVYGISSKKRLLKIELPIIFRFVLPSFLILQVNMLHLTLFGSLISVDEIFRTCQRINAQIYQPVEIYTALGIFFIIVCLPLNSLAYWLKTKFSRDLSER